MGVNLPIPNVNSPFRFWCQKALPLVYDDSLSYYEVLCKLTKYVNGLREDVILLGKDVSDLNNLYNELKALVEKYYEHGVQSSVDKKLDEMAENGYFEDIIARYIKDDFPLFFETTTKMIETNLAVGTKVRTQGYYKSCDGGACDFIISNTETPYSIKLNNGNYANVCTVNSVITPEIFGAKGDGVTDDSVALQKALDCCFKNETNNTFKGTRYKNYAVTTPIDIDMTTVPNSDGLIDFNGAKITAIADKMKYVLSYNTIGYYNGSFVHHSKTTLTNVVIDCNYEKAHTGLYIIYGAGAIFSNINVYGCRRGILLAGGVENSIEHCFIRRNGEDDLVEKMDKDGDGIQDSTWVDNLKDVFPENNREEILVDGKINLIKTQCVGIELRSTDCFIRDCITVDCVIGIKTTGGDHKITGCHPWNASCQRQIYSSCCLFVSGSTYVTNLTCDRFYIGVYAHYNQKNFFSNTLFTNQPLSFDTTPHTSYCWFISEQDLYDEGKTTGYAYKSNGATIFANNTQVYGNRKTDGLVRDLKWCNLTYNAVHDTNTYGYNVLDYMPHIDERNNDETGTTNDISTIKNDTYGKIKSSNSTIVLDSVCDNDLYTEGETNSGYSNHTIYANNCKISCEKENGEAWVTMLQSPDISRGAYMVIGSRNYGTSVPLNLINGHKYLISFKYKTTNTNARIFTTAKNAIYITNEKLEADGAEHIWWNMFDYENKFTWAIGVADGNNANNISITNIRCYDITYIPRYFLENRGAYFKRLTDFIGGSMQSITVPVRNDISFISTQFPIEFNKDSDVNSSKPNYDELSNFYTVRYNRLGKPMIWSHKSTIKNGSTYTYFENVADIKMNKNMYVYFNAFMTETPNCFTFVVKQKKTTQFATIGTIAGNSNDGIISANRFNGDIRLVLRNKENTENKPITVTHFEANYDDSCDYPIVDNGGLIPLYHNGGIYPILKGSGENEDYMRELPTVCYTIEY